jgi:CHAD domain-containing protein
MQDNALPFPTLRNTPGIQPSDSMAEAGRKVLYYHFARMLHHEPGTRLGEDIEALHDMRVATRRMRSAFDVFGDAFDSKAVKPHVKGLRRTGKALGRVRDLDVFLEKAGHFLHAAQNDHPPDISPLLNAWRAQRETARERMLIFLDGEKYQAFRQDFNIFVQTPGLGARIPSETRPTPQRVTEIVPILIYTQMAAVRAYERVLAEATLEQLHRLRIEFKKLRYSLEFFREVLGPEARAVIQKIKAIQDHLGNLNDADVVCENVAQFLDGQGGENGGLEPVRAYLEARKNERQRLLDTFPEAWANFNRPELRENLAMAVAVL